VKRWLVAVPVALVLLIGAIAGAWWLRRPKLAPPPTPQRLAALKAERDALEEKLRTAVVAHGERSVMEAPKGGLMLGIPTSFTASIVEQVVTGLFNETTLVLRNLKVQKKGEVKAKMLIRKRKLGSYSLDVTIHEARGLLRPGKPTLQFGGNRVGVVLPVRLAQGEGRADLQFGWDSKGAAANMVCGDVEVVRPVTGNVTPEDYTLGGSFDIASAGEAILLRPRFPDLAVRLRVDPSEDAWAVVEEVVKKQRKGCEIALNKVDIKEKLSQILGRGFNVKIPQKIFKPIRLPAGVSQSLEVQGIRLALHVKPTGVLVANDRIWYGADVRLSRSAAPPSGSKPREAAKTSKAPKASQSPKAPPPPQDGK